MKISTIKSRYESRCSQALPVLCFAILAVLLLTGAGSAAEQKRIGLFVGDVDAHVCTRAVKEACLPGVEVRIFTGADTGSRAMIEFTGRMDVAVVDIMKKKPAGWLLSNLYLFKPNVRLYAVREGADTEKYLDAGFLMEKTVRAYFDYPCLENLVNLLKYISHRDLEREEAFGSPVKPPQNALYHPHAPGFFTDPDRYFEWYRDSGRFNPQGLWDLFLIFPTFTLDGKSEVVKAAVRAYEARGINVMVWMRERKDQDGVLKRLVSSGPLVGRLGSITGFTFRFSSTLTSGLLDVLKAADVPVINVQTLFFGTRDEWFSSPRGISPSDFTLQFSIPELSGLVEPTVVGCKQEVDTLQTGSSIYSYVPVEENIERLGRRVARWHALRRKPNEEKKIVLLYYNHMAGKQNIGASYLNVFRSIREIIQALRDEGYAIEGDPTEDLIKDMILKSGRNIGSWAPGELEVLSGSGGVAFVEMKDYQEWFSRTPAGFRRGVEEQWGRPEHAKIMVDEGRFVIPRVRLGNLIIAPQPVRGLSDDADKLYHSSILQPHHQYNAFYYWLQEVVKPDAIISLGTHGTLEYLPGKQAGLTWQCPSEVLIGEIPNIYPYIVDNVGEGLQAKRRGRGVVIDHATPPFKEGGLYEEYSVLAGLISDHEAAASCEIREARMKRIREMTLDLGLDRDLELDVVDESVLGQIEHYILTLKTELIPYGLHTFGVSPSGRGLLDTASAMAARGDRSAEFYEERLKSCGPSEMGSLLRGLRGGYIAPAPGNDPVRNPESLPTGRNFYGFDPARVPSKEAWTAGRSAGEEIIKSYRARHDGAYPAQVGLILWSIETIRDEGINIATALYLMGMTPVWDKRDKVAGVKPIPGSQLNRPRIDVLLQMSGLFRDTFPSAALLLDKAVKEAATLTDLDNFIREHSKRAEQALAAEGYSTEEARKLSLVRLFSARPGAYGTKVADMTGASGLWENDDAVAEEGFINTVSFGYSNEIWGERLTPVYRRHLRSVDATVHSISSNLYSTMDNDDMFQYLGGLSMAVQKESGEAPDVFVSLQRSPGRGRVEPLAATLGKELRTRYLNPGWIEGMKKEGYAGAREMSEFAENMWGWQVTVKDAVDSSKWRQVFEVYVEDKYEMDLDRFFDDHNPWAYQSLTARMLEAVRKGYWQAEEETVRKLSAEYAVNVIEKGVACCDHTCNNPMLNQMVANIISLPGVLSLEMVDEFKLAVEQASAEPFDRQTEERVRLLERLDAAPGTAEWKPSSPDQLAREKDTRTVEGYKMEDMDTPDETTTLTSSGVQWAASLFVAVMVCLFMCGLKRRK